MHSTIKTMQVKAAGLRAEQGLPAADEDMVQAPCDAFGCDHEGLVIPIEQEDGDKVHLCPDHLAAERRWSQR